MTDEIALLQGVRGHRHTIRSARDLAARGEARAIAELAWWRKLKLEAKAGKSRRKQRRRRQG